MQITLRNEKPKNNDDIFLSVVIPAYNEEKRIGPTLESIDTFLSNKPYKYEIIVVDDGSTDNTVATVGNHRHYIKNIKLIESDRNHGKGYAVHTGMDAARGRWRLFMDADNSVHIENVDYFLLYANMGNDVVIASIAYSHNGQVVEKNGWHRRFLSGVSKFIIRSLVTPGIRDTQRGFKLFSARAADIVFNRQTIDRFGFDIELLVIAQTHHFKIKELPVAWNNPDGSTVRPRDYFRTLNELVKIISNRLNHRYN